MPNDSCNTLDDRQSEWIFSLQIVTILFNAGLLVFGTHNVIQYVFRQGKFKTVSLLLFYIMSLLTLSALIMANALIQESNPNGIAV